MGSLNDGLGGEEIITVSGAGLQAQSPLFVGSVTATNQISGLNVFATGSTIAGRVQGSVQVSGLDVYAVGSIIGARVQATVHLSGLNVFATGSITDADGRLRNANVGSPATFGAFVQTGSVTTSAGSGGTLLFGKVFTTANYFVALSPNNFVAGAGSIAAYVSGTKITSGCEIVGAASTPYAYIAVGN